MERPKGRSVLSARTTSGLFPETTTNEARTTTDVTLNHCTFQIQPPILAAQRNRLTLCHFQYDAINFDLILKSWFRNLLH